MATAYKGRMTTGAPNSGKEDDKSSFDQRIIEEIQIDEIRIDRIGSRRYKYMMVAYELGNLGGTLELRGELGYIRRNNFSKPQVFASKHSRQSARDSGTALYSIFRVRSLDSQEPTRLFVCMESTMSLHNVVTPAASTPAVAAGVTTTFG